MTGKRDIMTERDKVTADDIIGLIHTDETTNSVELKKDLYRDTENKRFEIKDEGWYTIYDNEKNEYVISDGMLNAHHYCNGLCNLLNGLHKENQTLLHIIDWCLTHQREVGHIVFDSRDEFFIWLKEKGVL